MVDPYPLMTLEYALEAFKLRFGAIDVIRAKRQAIGIVHSRSRDEAAHSRLKSYG
jgi:hypothetical protein